MAEPRSLARGRPFRRARPRRVTTSRGPGIDGIAPSLPELGYSSPTGASSCCGSAGRATPRESSLLREATPGLRDASARYVRSGRGGRGHFRARMGRGIVAATVYRDAFRRSRPQRAAAHPLARASRPAWTMTARGRGILPLIGRDPFRPVNDLLDSWDMPKEFAEPFRLASWVRIWARRDRLETRGRGRSRYVRLGGGETLEMAMALDSGSWVGRACGRARHRDSPSARLPSSRRPRKSACRS